MVNLKEKGHINGETDVHSKENSKMDLEMERVIGKNNPFHRIYQGHHIMESTSTIRSVVMVHIYGQVVITIKVNSLLINDKAMVKCTGSMNHTIKVNGIKVCNMDKAS